MMNPNMKRVALTLPPEIDGVLTKLSKMQKVPKTQIITELLRDVVPVLEQVIQAMEEAKKGQQKLAIETMSNFLGNASAKLNQAHIDFGGIKAKNE